MVASTLLPVTSLASRLDRQRAGKYFASLAIRPLNCDQRRVLRPPPFYAQGKILHFLIFNDRFSWRTDMYAVAAAEFAAESTTDILVNKYIPL